MARATRAKTHKGVNGTGDSVTVYFDAADPAERKALEAARLLAVKHGRRKQAIVALLEAVYNYYEQTGELISASEISGALTGRVGQILTIPVQSPPRRELEHAGGVQITQDKLTATADITKNFLGGMMGFLDS
ncbi:MAG: hypothetical protein ABI700_07720 [Chloroflexota bacterium]